MPVRPAPPTWQLPDTFTPEQFEAAMTGLAKALGWPVRFEHADDDGERVRLAILDAPEAGVRERASDPSSLDAAEGGRYPFTFELHQLDDGGAQFQVDLEREGNWAALEVVLELAAGLAEGLGGRDVTGDPPAWLAAEMARIEPASPNPIPVLALRDTPAFPGFAASLGFGRPASVARIRELVASERPVFLALLQRDPADEAPSTAGLSTVGVLTRVVRAFENGENGLMVLLKGIARARVTQLESTPQGFTATWAPVADDETNAECDDLRTFADVDPLVFDAIGVTAAGQLEEMRAGRLCDLLAQYGDHGGSVLEVLEATTAEARVKATRALLGDRLAF